VVLTGREVTSEDRQRLAGVQTILMKGRNVRSDVLGEVRKIARHKPDPSLAPSAPAGAAA
jgi:hypothetical protein